MNEITRYLSFSDWLISLSIMFSRSIMPSEKVRFPFFSYSWIVLHCVNVAQLFYPLIYWHFCCFQILGIVNKAAMNIAVNIFIWIGVLGSFGYIPSSGITGSKGSSIFSFLRKFHTAFHTGYASLHSHQQRAKVLWRDMFEGRGLHKNV